MQAPRNIRRFTALLLAAALLLTACGGGAKATTMHLKRTEGRVNVSDDGGKDVEPRNDLGLYSGYEVDTKSDSYAWIDLDEVKLTKLDEKTEIEIKKDGKDLEIIVNEGSLFFNVTEPLADDETMTIRASTMAVGIRGTCGWVEVPDSGTMKVFLLEGKVRCETEDNHETIRAGEMAVMTEDGEITVSEFTAADVPAFVVEEIEDNDDLAEAILDASGIDMTGGDGAASGDLADYADILDQIRANGNEILYTEILDFEADGNPELLVLLGHDNGYNEVYITGNIYRKGPDGSVERVTSSTFLSRCAVGKISLVESGGRLYLRRFCHLVVDGIWSYDHIRDYYWGSVAQKDGSPDDWNYVEELQMVSDKSGINYFRSYRDGRGLCANPPRDGYDESVSAAEYAAVQASYNEVKVLIYSPDGLNVIVTPDPSEIEDFSQLAVTEPEPTPETDQPGTVEPQQPEQPPAVTSETISALPADFVGEYTAADESKYFPVTFSSNGKCSGNGDKITWSGPYNHYGAAPQSMTQNSDGSVVVTFSYCTYTFYPAGHADNPHSGHIGLKYVSTTSYGYDTNWYYK